MKTNSNAYANALKHEQDELALQYLPALKAMVYHLKERLPSSIEFSDLVSIGTEELIKLARKYDPAQNDSFWGYARTRVYGALLDYLRELDPISRPQRTLIKKIDQVVSKYYNEHQEEPDIVYLAEVLGESEETIKKAQISSEIYGIMPLDEEIAAKTEDKTQEIIERAELAEYIQKVLQDCSKQEQMVVSLYYYDELNFREIADILQITESRVCQINKAVLRKLRVYLEKGGYDG